MKDIFQFNLNQSRILISTGCPKKARLANAAVFALLHIMLQDLFVREKAKRTTHCLTPGMWSKHTFNLFFIKTAQTCMVKDEDQYDDCTKAKYYNQDSSILKSK